jgi:SagB-type dehydrogenase family enzyme
MGGATEAAIWSNLQLVDEVPDNWSSIPYGLPLANQRYHVLTENFQPSPDWVPGDLYIAGSGLALGYLNDPEKTAASFLIHPQSGERIYKTGDLGRYWPDGTLEFLGRQDSQVKVNGYRIELGEVEAAMVSCPEVSSAAAAIVEDGGGARLVGFVTAASAASQGGAVGAHSADDISAMRAEGITLVDPVERLQFKQKKLNLRNDITDKPHLSLFTSQKDQNSQLLKYSERMSFRRFLNSSVTFKQISDLLGELRGFTHDTWPVVKYRYGSAGWTYAVQTYLLIKPDRFEGLDGGAYYYHPLKNELIFLADLPKNSESFFPIGNREIFADGAFAIFLVANIPAIEPLYGQRSHEFVLIEAGLISQLLESATLDLDLGLCQIGAVEFENLRGAFQLTPEHHYLHCLIGGPIKRQPGWIFLDSLADSMPESQLAPSVNHIPALIKSQLHQWLPQYMVPSTIIVVDSIPLNSNGKIDRKALAEIALGKKDSATFVAPRNDSEAQLAKVVADVLGSGPISVTENFFDLGATSLHLVHVQRRLSEILDKQVSITELFEHPNISALSSYFTGKVDSQDVLEAAENRAQIRKRLQQVG